MTGAALTIQAKINDAQLHAAIDRLVSLGADLRLVFADIGEYLMISHRARFESETDPDGNHWQPLSPATLKRKGSGKKILEDHGYLRDLLRYQAGRDRLLFGSDRVYAAIQHYGGKIEVASRSQQLYFKRGRDGSVGHRFVARKRSDFAQWATLAAHSREIPARPFLGLSEADKGAVLRILGEHVSRAFLRSGDGV